MNENLEHRFRKDAPGKAGMLLFLLWMTAVAGDGRAGEADDARRLSGAMTQLVQGNVAGAVSQALPAGNVTVGPNANLYYRGASAGVHQTVGIWQANPLRLGAAMGASAGVNPSGTFAVAPSANVQAVTPVAANTTSFRLPAWDSGEGRK